MYHCTQNSLTFAAGLDYYFSDSILYLLEPTQPMRWPVLCLLILCASSLRTAGDQDVSVDVMKLENETKVTQTQQDFKETRNEVRNALLTSLARILFLSRASKG